MHLRRLASLVLGMWLGGSIFMAAVAILNFRSVDLLLEEPSARARETIRDVGGPAEARFFLRYHAAEQNRLFFDYWEVAQLGLGTIIFLMLVFFGRNEGTLAMAVTLAMVALVAAAHWLVLPSIVGLGREVDFLAADAASPIRAQLKSWHTTYSTLEIIKLGLGVFLAYLLARTSHRRRSPASALDEAVA